MLLTSCATTYRADKEIVIISSKSGLTDAYQHYRVTLKELVENTESRKWTLKLYENR